MTDRTDHTAEALYALSQARATPADASVVADPWLLTAQVHATLALVEQQRIANLIALRRDSREVNSALLSFVEPVGQNVLRPEIREALGLA